MRLSLSALILSFLLFGCATTPPPASEIKPVPPERLLAYQTKLPETSGTIVVTRDFGALGAGCYYALSINGTLAGRFDVSEVARFYVPPGELLLRVGRDPLGKGLCSIGQDDWTQRETLMKPNESKQFRLSIDANGKTDIQRADN